MPVRDLGEALLGGYYVRLEDRNEMAEMLSECQELGVRWLEGQRALDYTPPANIVVRFIDYIHGGLHFSQNSIGNKHVNWSDLSSGQYSPAPRFNY